jgi:hypothetical protein
MKKAFVALLVLFAVLSTLSLDVSRAIPSSIVSPIYIRSDGSIEPSSAPILHNGNIYTLTDNIQNCNITIQRNNITLNGAGFDLQGPGMNVFNVAAVSLNCSNVTIFNFHIFNWSLGVLGAFDNNTIQSNYFSNNIYDVALYANNYKVIGNQIGPERIVGKNNIISQNQIVLGDYETGFWLTNCTALQIESNNITFSRLTTFFISTQISEFQVYHNNFLNVEVLAFGTLLFPKSSNTKPWDNGIEGNYWSDYARIYTQAVETGNSGIGNITYVSKAAPQVIDRYPLIKPYDYSLPSSPTVPELSWLVILPLLLGNFLIAIMNRYQKVKKASSHVT